MHPVNSCPRRAGVDARHVAFLALLPRLQTHARIYFRGVRCPVAREEAIQETLALAWQWYVRLTERGKDACAFPMVFAALVARAVKSGRRVCGQDSRDVLSRLAQKRHGFRVEPLPAATRASHEHLCGSVTGQRQQDAFEERLRDDTRTPVPDQAAFRLDWPCFLQTLSRRDRDLVNFLALGHQATHAAARFGLSAPRVTQLRQQWCRQWRSLQGEDNPGRDRRRQHAK